MPSASILGYTTGTGQWGAYGTSGHWIRSASGDITQSLPAGISSVSCAEGSVAGLTAGDDRAMRIASGPGAALVLQTSGGSAFTMSITATSPTTAYIAALRLIAVSGSRNYTLAVKSSDGATTYASGTTPDAGLGVWAYIQCEGSVRFDLGGSFPRYQGVLFDPASTAYNESSWAGMAIGGEWLPNLAISGGPAWAGIEVAPGSGLSPGSTMVESGWGGLAIGPYFPDVIASTRQAWAGVSIGGLWEDAAVPASGAAPDPEKARWRRIGPDPARSLSWRRRGG